MFRLLRLIKKARSTSLKRPLVLLIATSLIIAILLRLFPRAATAAWFDDNWGFRVRYPINSTAGQTNQKFKIDIDTATLITNGQLQSDCGDSRFTDESGQQLRYFLDSAGGACNSASTDYYVLIPTINNGVTNVYHYYGNPAATNGTELAQFSEATCSTCTLGTPGSVENGPRPVSYWNFDEGTGGTTNDVTLQNNDLTITAAIWRNPDLCVFGNCLSFDGNADYATKTYSSDNELLPGTGSFTISAWFKHTSNISGSDILISRVDAVNGVGWKLYSNTSGFLCFGIDDVAGTFPADSACGSTNLADSQWHYISGVKSGTSTITLYIDGRQVAQTAVTASGSLNGTNAPFTVGNDFDNLTNGWDGFIDEVKYYNFAKIATQITTEYAAKSQVKGASTTFGAGSAATSLSQGLLGYWRMNDPGVDVEGEISTDSSGNGFGGTLNGDNGVGDNGTGMTCIVSGKFNTGCDFDGVDDYVSNSSSVLGLTGPMTLAAWFKTDVTGLTITIASKDGATNNQGYVLRYSSGNRLTASLAAPNPDCSTQALTQLNGNTTTLTSGTWYHGAMVYDGTKLSLYLNGNLDGSTPYTGSVCASTTNFNIGARNNNTQFFDGTIDDVRLYNRALSPAEVASLYNWAPGPIGWWKMDENTGTSIADSSGNGNSMIMQGSLSAGAWSKCKYGSCLNFDGTNASAELDPSTTLFDDLPQLTATAWIYNTGPSLPATTMRIVSNQKGGNTAGWHLVWDTTGRIRIDVDYTGNDLIARHSLLSANTWYFVAVTWDGTTTAATAVNLYVDGVEPVTYVQQQDATLDRVSDASTTQELAIGASPTSFGEFSGFIDDVRVYNYVRTPKQIIEDMNAGHPAPGSPVGSYVSRWKFDDMTGTTAQDSTASNNDLTLNTAVWTTAGKFDGAWNGATGAFWLDRAVDDEEFDFVATDDLSFSFWFKSDSATNPAATEYILKKGTITSTGDAGYAIYANTSGNVIFGIKDDGDWGVSSPNTPAPDDTATSTADIYDGTWHHIVATKIGTSRIDLYVDGRLNASDTSLAAIGSLANTRVIRLGDDNANDANSFTGDLDEVKIFRFALSASEVVLDMNLGSSTTLGAVTDQDEEGFNITPPVGWWKLDDNTGTTATDTSGNATNNNGTLTNSPAWVPAKFGPGLRLIGRGSNSDFVNVPDTDDSLDFVAADSFSISAWVKTSDLASDLIVYNNFGTGFPGYRVRTNATGRAVCGIHDGTLGPEVQGTSDLRNNQWHFITCVRNVTTDTIAVYVDGIQEASINDTTTGTLVNTVALTIGRGNNVGSATVDDVRIYKYALSQAQISNIYNRGAPVAWYKFDECQGTTAFNAARNANGQAAGNNGTITIGSGGAENTLGDCSTASTAWGSGATGKFNSSIDLDGTDDYAALSSTTEPSFSASDAFTMSLWLNSTDTASRSILFGDYDGGATTASINLEVNDASNNVFRVHIEDVAQNKRDYRGSTNVLNGNWHQVAVTYDGANGQLVTFYVDGRVEPKTTLTEQALSGTLKNISAFQFGRDNRAGTHYLDGQLDDVRVYRYALTADQIKRLYNEGSASRFGPQTGSP